MVDWVSFWDTPHSIYVNDRHRDVHYRTIAQDMRRYVTASDAVVMDYGCGEALHADLLAAAARRLILVEAPPGIVAGLRAHFAAEPNIEVWTADQVAQCPDRSIDLIVLHSVAQYVSQAALDGLFAEFRRLLRPDGRLVVGDVIPPTVSVFADAAALLRFAAAHGFLGTAVLGLARTLFSDYPRLRKTLGLSLYDEPAMLRKLAAAGFVGARMPTNIGHNQARMTFFARRT
jgi:SAM-dependent methyltransferase